MYKCSECGKVTENKPKYCDCGNDVFIPFEDNMNTKQSQKVMSTLPQVDRISLSIFLVCIILSIIPWFFVSRHSENVKKEQRINVPNEKKAVVDIDKLWDDTPIKVETPSVPEPIQVEEPQTIIEYVTQIVKVPAPVKQNSVAQNISKPKKEEVKPVQNSPKTQVQKPKPEVISRIEKNISSNNAVPQKVEKPVQKPKPAPVVNKPTAEELAELNIYKNNLRMVLLSKLNVQSIIGSGDCDIEFAINENGKLINRKFSKQSDNKSLNDAIYYMLMSVPVYQVPPKAYKGETIRLHFYINNGYYEISFK